jgi:outer membrane PBP1 activator LpoA protein
MRRGALHRLLVALLAAAILYGGAPALASEALTAPAPPPVLDAPLPLPPSGAGPLVLPAPQPRAGATAIVPAPGPAAGVPHIALLLPLHSGAFGRHAEAVRAGFFAAAKVHGELALPLRVYATAEEARDAIEGYRRAVAAGAAVVVGPLTRSGVAAVLEHELARVPTLALNVPEKPLAPPPGFYVLGLHAEAEARQVAQLAYREGFRNALTVVGDTALLRRIHEAFVQEFTGLGGRHVTEFPFASDPGALARIKQAAGLGAADLAFLALDFERARLVRPYLDPLALYATSQVHPGPAGPLAAFDLAAVRFLDMPWVLEPDHAAVMVYPRAGFESVELERLYALGIDALRIASELAKGLPPSSLDGVTGQLRLGPDQRFARLLTPAQFQGGRLAVVREPVR